MGPAPGENGVGLGAGPADSGRRAAELHQLRDRGRREHGRLRFTRPQILGCGALICVVFSGCRAFAVSEDAKLRSAFERTSGRIELPAGTIEIRAPLELPAGAHDVEIVGSPRGSVLRMAEDFRGKAAIIGGNVANIRLAGFEIAGSRQGLTSDRYLPAANQTFAGYYDANGLLFTESHGIRIRDISLHDVKSFPVLINHCMDVSIEGVSIKDSGTLNAQGHSNTTGGILLEEGTSGLSVRRCRIHDICGNGIWTHSNYHSPRNQDGLIEANEIEGTPRDAIQVGHALRMRVLNNRGARIGFPPGQVDTAALATPVAIDSAGDVANSAYSGNRFTDVDGQCIDLDGFHDGEVTDNSCINRGPLTQYPFLHAGIVFGNSFPEMQPGRVEVSRNTIEGFGYGGIFLIGEKNRVAGNQFIDINRNHCTGKPGPAQCNYAPDEPGMLRSGIYLAGHAARPARTTGNIIEGNTVTGFGARDWCIAAGPGVSLAANEIRGNKCSDTH